MITSLCTIAALVALAISGVLAAERVAERRQQDQLRIAIARASLADRERARRELERRIGARLEKYDRAAAADRARMWIRERRA